MATSTSTPTTGAETGEPGAAPRLVGAAVLLRPLPLPRDAGRAEIGFWLGVPYWGRGVMVEAIGLVLEHAFGTMGLAAVQAGAFPDNVRSRLVQEHMGFRPVDRAVRPAPARGRDRELVMYAIERADWEDGPQRSWKIQPSSP